MLFRSCVSVCVWRVGSRGEERETKDDTDQRERERGHAGGTWVKKGGREGKKKRWIERDETERDERGERGD